MSRKFFELMLIDSGPHDVLKGIMEILKNLFSMEIGSDNKEIGSHEIRIDRGFGRKKVSDNYCSR